MADDHDQSQSLAAAQEKVKQLTVAVRDLRLEASRLQANLGRLHKFQASLLEVSQRWLEWMERGDRLKSWQDCDSLPACNTARVNKEGASADH